MIKNYNEHSANERTFLAWVRTSIGIIAFGFLVERFDLFLAFMMPRTLKERISVAPDEFGQVAGLVLIVLGVVMIAISAWRFARTAREIDDDRLFPGNGSRIDISLAVLLVLLASGLLFYLMHALSLEA